MVKFDMHCHTKEGSTDAKVPTIEYIKSLMSRGFGGMLVSDHNSYKGYYALEGININDFVVLKGIEYDTIDFGHMLVIMPDDNTPLQLMHRGMTLKKLMKIVHENGGILGPAHPCGETFLSFFTTGISKRRTIRKHEFLPLFDFLEGYNACEPELNNKRARYLAKKYNIPMFAGSDAHKIDCVGLAYTCLPDNIKSNNDLIRYIKTRPSIRIGGRRYGKTIKDKLGRFNKFLVYSFFPYNKCQGLIGTTRRRNLK
ncbi:MAG: hypothetical protein MJZ11_04840 [Lachnospiraceae bacterium]|nr:hypothetical protein [Lachnospiraceae bacterium]